jgi:hypothetical protein
MAAVVALGGGLGRRKKAAAEIEGADGAMLIDGGSARRADSGGVCRGGQWRAGVGSSRRGRGGAGVEEAVRCSSRGGQGQKRRRPEEARDGASIEGSPGAGAEEADVDREQARGRAEEVGVEQD